MNSLNSFTLGSRAAVVGASGGIGRAFTTQLAEDPNFDHVYALSRSETTFAEQNVSSHKLDYAEPASIESCARLIEADGPLDLVVVATGILHRGKEIRPEKSMADIEAGQIAEVFSINTIGPALVARCFLPLMRRDRRTVFAAMSARVGSIADNRLGGWLAYRSSKAAMNMVIKTLSVEQTRKRPNSLVVALHPGTVQTDLSQPFTRRISDEQLFSPSRAASQLLSVIDKLPDDASGGFFAWDGSAIQY